jgi:phosphate transport system protein
MSHYEERLEQDLTQIKDGVAQVGAWVQENVHDAVLSVTASDRRRANQTILRDRAVNKRIDELDHLCHLFVVKHLPSAGHLRFVSSVLRINVALERIGDYATTVCREMLQLSEAPPESIVEDVAVLGEQIGNALRASVLAFVEGSTEKAAEGLGMAKQVEATYIRAVHDLITYGESKGASTRDLFSLLISLRVLKRVSDQAENICEQTTFQVTGDLKEEKTYRILFVDERNDLLSKMAEGFASLAYPDSGRFRSAGAAPADALDAGFVEFMERRGLDVTDKPVALDRALDRRRHFHVIVGVGVKPSKYIQDIPFRTATIEWDVSEVVRRAEEAGGQEKYQALYREIAERVTELMETLGVESQR